MEEEALLQSGANSYERTNSRKASRNGYKSRTLLTKFGKLELSKPQLREFPFETEVFDRYSRVEKAILCAVTESYLQGVSTRRVENIMSALGVGDISSSSVSRITKELDENVEEFLSKPIEHGSPIFSSMQLTLRLETAHTTRTKLSLLLQVSGKTVIVRSLVQNWLTVKILYSGKTSLMI